MSQIRFSLQARRDLQEIEEYISRDNPAAAARFIETLLNKFVVLSEQPGMGRNRGELRANLRSFPCGNYVIFYFPVSDGVEILRVLHGARDLPELFEME